MLASLSYRSLTAARLPKDILQNSHRPSSCWYFNTMLSFLYDKFNYVRKHFSLSHFYDSMNGIWLITVCFLVKINGSRKFQVFLHLCLMKVYFGSDLSDLIVYFAKCDHWSLSWGGCSVLHVLWSNELEGLCDSAKLLSVWSWCFTWVRITLSALVTNTLLPHLFEYLYSVYYSTPCEHFFYHKKQENIRLAGFKTGKEQTGKTKSCCKIA